MTTVVYSSRFIFSAIASKRRMCVAAAGPAMMRLVGIFPLALLANGQHMKQHR